MKSLVVKILLTFSIAFFVGSSILFVIFIQSCQKSTDADNVIKDKPEYTIGTIDSIGVIHNEFLQYFFDEMKDQEVCPEQQYIFKYNNHQYIRKAYYTDMCGILKEAAIQRGWSEVDVDNEIDSINTFFSSISMFEVVNGIEVVKRIQDNVENILQGALLQGHINSDIYDALTPSASAYAALDTSQIDVLVEAIDLSSYSGETLTYLCEFLSIYNHSHDFWNEFSTSEGSQLNCSAASMRKGSDIKYFAENPQINGNGVSTVAKGTLLSFADALGGAAGSRLGPFGKSLASAAASGLASALMELGSGGDPMPTNPWAPAFCYCGCLHTVYFCPCGD